MSCRQSEPVALCDVSLLITQTFFHFIYIVFLHVAKWKSADIKVGRHCPSSGRSRSLKYLWARLPKRPWHPFMLTWHQQPLRHDDANRVRVHLYIKRCAASRSFSAEFEGCTLTNTSTPRADWMCRWKRLLNPAAAAGWCFNRPHAVTHEAVRQDTWILILTTLMDF